MEYRVLIVNEDAAERNRYAETLISAPPAPSISYQVATVGSVAAAQLQATRQRFNLVIVALSQHDDGLQLVSRLKDLFPDMRLLLLCEQGITKAQLVTARLLRANIAESTIDAESFRAVVADLLGINTLLRQQQEAQQVQQAQQKVDQNTTQRTTPTLHDNTLQPFFEPFLDELRRQTKANVTLIIDKQGTIIGQLGTIQHVMLDKVAQTVANSTTQHICLDKILNDSNTVHLSVYEGTHYDVYAANIGADRFLALVFQKEFSTPKLGLVWLVMKRTVEKFKRLR
jgi:predicted regulator of Ras-like GTPase activity (Roadblock/LC7/MglB family)/DNA-binding NarL/FixJ family response regulator